MHEDQSAPDRSAQELASFHRDERVADTKLVVALQEPRQFGGNEEARMLEQELPCRPTEQACPGHPCHPVLPVCEHRDQSLPRIRNAETKIVAAVIAGAKEAHEHGPERGEVMAGQRRWIEDRVERAAQGAQDDGWLVHVSSTA